VSAWCLLMLLSFLVDFFAMAYCSYYYFVFRYLVDYSVVSDS